MLFSKAQQHRTTLAVNSLVHDGRSAPYHPYVRIFSFPVVFKLIPHSSNHYQGELRWHQSRILVEEQSSLTPLNRFRDVALNHTTKQQKSADNIYCTLASSSGVALKG